MGIALDIQCKCNFGVGVYKKRFQKKKLSGFLDTALIKSGSLILVFEANNLHCNAPLLIGTRSDIAPPRRIL